MQPGEVTVGFHGKLPSAGDFVQRRLPPAFVSSWDRSFEHAVAESRNMLGSDWNDAYRSSPIWRLMLSAGVCGPTPWAGVIGPGVDRVGRCFPLVIVRNLGPDPQLPLRTLAMSDWFDAAQTLLATALAGGMPVDAFDREVAALDRVFGHLPDAWTRVQDVDLSTDRHWRMALPAETAGVGLLQTAWRRAVDGSAAAIWWTGGGARMPPSLLITAGLPGPSAYAGFLDAGAATTAWQTLGSYPSSKPAKAMAPALAPAEQKPAGDVLLDLFPDLGRGAAAAAVDPDETQPARARHAAPTPAARSAATNRGVAACARLQSSDGALTLIASDAGDRDPGQRAAQWIVEALADGAPAVTAALLQQRLLAVHQRLRLAADDLVDPVHADCAIAAATVTAGARGMHASLLAVGAAQTFLWRSSGLLALAMGRATAAQAAGDLPSDDLDDLLFSPPSAAPAGLGAEHSPGFECCEIEVLPGDRLLLLATPRLTGLPPTVLAHALALPTTVDAEARIAAAASLPPDISAWPFAVIEVSTP